MKIAEIPDNERERLNALYQYQILDTESEPIFDEIARVAALAFGCDHALVSLIDVSRQWFKAKVGVDVDETPRSVSFCGHTILQDKVLIIEDTHEDERFRDNPFVVKDPKVRFYAGVPLVTPDGYKIGSLCVFDSKKQIFGVLQKMILQSMAKQVIEHLELRKKSFEQDNMIRLVDHTQRIAMVGGWELDVASQRTRWSEQALMALGLNPDSSIGFLDAIKALQHGDDEAVLKNIRACVLEGRDFDDVFEIGRSDDEFGWLRIKAELVYRNEQKNPFLRGVIQDVTEKVKQDEELNKQIELAQQNAKMASLGKMAAGIGHEINNPLSIIKGYLSTMERKVDKGGEVPPKDWKKFIDRVEAATDRVAQIVQGLRSFGNEESFEKSQFDVVLAIQNAISTFHSSFEEEDIDFTAEIPESVNLQFLGDQRSFEQVIYHLLNNAKDAVQGGNQKQVKLQLVEYDDSFHILINDSGCGIPLGIQDRIFDPFFTTKDVNQGTGLGLSTVCNFALEHEGVIRFDSTVGEGTCFELILPTKAIAPAQEMSPMNKSGDAEPSVRSRVSAIIADDEPDIRELLAELLKDIDVETTLVENGKQAFQLYKENPSSYDLIISDMRMPLMGGIDLLKAIVSETDLVKPKFVFLTGEATNRLDSEHQDLEDSVDAYFSKPFNVTEIFEFIQNKVVAPDQKAA